MRRDDAEFTAFVEASQASLLRTAWLLTGNGAAAEELVQAALVKTYVAWPRVRRESATAYARKIVVRLHLDSTRRGHREPLTRTGSVPERASHDVYSESGDEILALLQYLPPRQRAIVVLRYYADASEADTARTLGITAGAVKSGASRGLATLRRLMDPAAADADAARSLT